jgi:hypothetical protein
MVDMRGDPPDNRTAAAGEEQLDVGMVEKRVLARGDQLERLHPQRRHPGGIAGIEPVGELDKSLAFGLGVDRSNRNFCLGHDLAFVRYQCDLRAGKPSVKQRMRR